MHQLVEADPDVEVIWRAFELRPEPVPPRDPKGDYLQRVWDGSVYPLAERLGITMRLPPIQPRSRLAHEAAHWARAQGRFDDYHAEIFRAFFERGEDIGNSDVLVALALKLELDTGSLRPALASHQFQPGVLMDERDAARLGVSGVPAFIADRKAALSGVQPLETLRKLIENVRNPG